MSETLGPYLLTRAAFLGREKSDCSSVMGDGWRWSLTGSFWSHRFFFCRHRIHALPDTVRRSFQRGDRVDPEADMRIAFADICGVVVGREVCIGREREAGRRSLLSKTFRFRPYQYTEVTATQ